MQTSARNALIVTTAAGFWMRQRNGRKISLSNSQHWILHVLCAPQQRSRKGRGDHPKMVFSIFFTFSFEHFRFAIFGKTKTIAQNRGRIQSRQAMPGFSCLYYKTTWPFAARFFFCQRREFPSHLWSPEATSMFSCRNETEILCRSNSIKFSNQVARILISVIIRKQLSTASVPHVR